MYTKTEILNKVEALKESSPAPAAFNELDSAIATYFDSDADLARETAYTICQLTTDATNKGTIYEHQELLPSAKDGEEPKGYNDIREIFDVAGIWDEMMATSSVTQEQIENWIASIEEARGEELAGLKAVSDFCEAGSYNTGMAVLFEDLGDVIQSVDKDSLLERIYTSGGFLELIKVFGMDIYIPSKLRQEEKP